jgi:FAD/FMN-containing dehydrogenase
MTMAGILPKSIPPCPQWDCLIAAGLQSKQILLPDSDDYEERIESYWSSSAKLRPACIVQPQSATEVASVVKALATAGLTFAIRSGGSNFSTASNNISSDGVTIDLGQMASIVFDPEREIAHIGPAARWGQVCLFQAVFVSYDQFLI